MSDELTRQNIQALLDERHGYEVRLVDADTDTKVVLKERVSAVNAVLRNLGYEESKAQPAKTSKPAKPSSQKRPAARTSKRAATKKG